MNSRSEEFLNTFNNFGIISEEFYNYLVSNGFFTQVASTKFHGDYEGGLYDHSKNVMNQLVMFTEKLDLQWERKESPYIIGMFHDLCKIDAYQMHDDGTITYNSDIKSLGHGDRSVSMIEKFLKLTDEEKLCITYHMGAYETNHWNEFDKAIKKYPNVLWTHQADMIASKLLEKGRNEINEENTSKNMRSK